MKEREISMDLCVTLSPEGTQTFGRTFGALIKPGDVIALIGELGAGKTCLTQAICEGLNVQDDVVSPTFTLINVYHGRIPVYHFDLYRLDEAESVLDLGFDEFVDGEGVCLIEWADKFPEILPHTYIEIRIEILDQNQRQLTVTRKKPLYTND